MAVLIKGMVMPVRCFECPAIDLADGLWCAIADKDLRKEHGINLSRPDWCPLIEVHTKTATPLSDEELEECHFEL